MSIDINEQIKCVERELSMRRHVYPKWVDIGRLRQLQADQEIERMEAVLRTLQDVAEKQEFELV